MMTRDRYPVKPPRRTSRPDAPFGAGVLPGSVPAHQEVATAEDEAWAAQAFRAQREREELAARLGAEAFQAREFARRMGEGWRF